MSDDARLIELETRIAFQEQAQIELSDLVHRQHRELEALRRALAQANADLHSLRDSLPDGASPEPPPPHY